MPIYEYEILDKDGVAKGVFETMQKLSDPVLTTHPDTGEPVRRIFSRTFVGSSDSYDGGYEGGDCASGACGMASAGGCPDGSCGWD
jgi:predicted nucleic acid-binding Zn ribbon protein